MSPVSTTAYNSVEDILNLARAILNDAEVPGGDVLTDSAPFSLRFANIAYESVQRELAKVGIETLTKEAWLINVPAVTNIDPETRVLIADTGTQVITASGIGGSSFASPQLPTDLVAPLKLWERQNNTTNFPVPMKQPNGGIFAMTQQTFLVDWMWMDDALQFRGALQAQDIKLKYEKHLPIFALVADPVPIRGVNNAAAYYLAKAFTEARGGKLTAAFAADGMTEIENMRTILTRRKQRKLTRRRPYSGRGGRPYPVL